MIKDSSETEQIAVQTEARNLSDGYGSDETPGAKLLTAVNIRQMDFYGREGGSGKSVTDGNAGMSISSRIYEYPIIGTDGGMDPVDKSTF